MADNRERLSGQAGLVSLVICTRNRARLLRRLLVSLKGQTLPPGEFEVVVVDDGSTDETPEVCRELSEGPIELRCLCPGSHIGAAAARNCGMEEARGDLLVFTDDDCVPHEQWLERMRSALREHPVVAGAVATATDDYWQLCHNIAQFYGFMPGRPEGPTDFIAGANMGFRRKVLEEVGGFRQMQRYAADIECVFRARQRGYRPFFVPDAVVTHDPQRTSAESIFRYAFDHGRCSIFLRHHYRELLRTPLVLRSPALLLPATPLIALKVTAGIYAGDPSVARHLSTLPVVYALKVAWCLGAVRGLMKMAANGDLT
ncbi:MAG: glycosyltransferase family 2 protein [Planctomycetota bacterium]|jgi:glycosyltransferase involved in cell wall biosynthesis